MNIFKNKSLDDKRYFEPMIYSLNIGGKKNKTYTVTFNIWTI